VQTARYSHTLYFSIAHLNFTTNISFIGHSLSVETHFYPFLHRLAHTVKSLNILTINKILIVEFSTKATSIRTH